MKMYVFSNMQEHFYKSNMTSEAILQYISNLIMNKLNDEYPLAISNTIRYTVIACHLKLIA